LLAVLSGFNTINSVIQVNFYTAVPEKVKKERPESLVKVLSFNVRLFGLYDGKESDTIRSKIFDLLSRQNAGIVCFQEYFTSDAGGFNNTDTLKKILGLSYPHIGRIKNLRDTEHWGLATFSRFPIINKGTIIFRENIYNNACIYSDIKVGKDTVRIYNIHLQSIHFVNDDYHFMENIAKEKEQKQLSGSQQIFRKLKTAFPKRAHQADLVAKHMKECPYPVLLCGDFNDPPTSYSYRTLFNSRKMKDAFVESGWGLGRTYTGAFPAFRIDYILHDEKFNSYHYGKIKEKLSDHYPVSCVIDFGSGQSLTEQNK
jgi:endonuclease/exonuclease/phosphatase family metal-dependent hydrolase